MGAPLAWHGTGAATFLYHPENKALPLYGFVQAMKRLARPEADIMAIAPHPDNHPRASAAIWQQLLEFMVKNAGGHGIQRLYICIDSDSSALPLITRCSFAPYIQETIFQLPPISSPLTPPNLSALVRPQQERDSFALHRLYTRYTPALVQQAEGRLLMNDDPPSPLHLRSWWQLAHSEGLVYEQQGDVIAAAHITRGNKGHWLRLYGAPEATDAVRDILLHSLNILSRYPPHPIYCTLRPYQTSFGPLLQSYGFRPGSSLTRLVKHTTIQNKQAVSVREMTEVPISRLIPSEYNLQPPAKNKPSSS